MLAVCHSAADPLSMHADGLRGQSLVRAGSMAARIAVAASVEEVAVAAAEVAACPSGSVDSDVAWGMGVALAED